MENLTGVGQKIVRETIAMLDSMVKSGEKHTEESRAKVKRALKMLKKD